MRRVQTRRGYGETWKAICTVLVWVWWPVKVLAMGAGAALVALYKQLKLLALTLTPGHEYDLESDRAGRAAELRVAALWVRLPQDFLIILSQNLCQIPKRWSIFHSTCAFGGVLSLRFRGLMCL